MLVHTFLKLTFIVYKLHQITYRDKLSCLLLACFSEWCLVATGIFDLKWPISINIWANKVLRIVPAFLMLTIQASSNYLPWQTKLFASSLFLGVMPGCDRYFWSEMTDQYKIFEQMKCLVDLPTINFKQTVANSLIFISHTYFLSLSNLFLYFFRPLFFWSFIL